MESVLLQLAKRVRRGVALLDKKVPGWRLIMRQNADDFDISNGECCILGTLEHKRGLARVRALRVRPNENGYETGKRRLRITEGHDYGFNTVERSELGMGMYDGEADSDEQWRVLNDLWRAEFSR